MEKPPTTALSLKRRSKNPKITGEIIDKQLNGLHVRRLDKTVFIEVIHGCVLQHFIDIAEFETCAEAQFAEILAKLLCAGATASIPRSTMMGMAAVINSRLDELGVLDRQPNRVCRSFSEDIPPTYEFAFYDSAFNGVVQGQVGVYAELHRHANAGTEEPSDADSTPDGP